MMRAIVIRLGLLAITIVGSDTGNASQVANTPLQPKEISPVSFDTEAAKLLIEWAHSGGVTPPAAWRSMRAYALTRQWAQWNGRPDPDLYVDQMLNEVALAKGKKQDVPRLIQAQSLLTELSNRRQASWKSAVAHLRSYLPPNTPIKGQVLFAVFIPTYAFSWGDGSIVLDLAADFWKGNPDKVFNLLVHELYHNGYGVLKKVYPPTTRVVPRP